ncbi:MAG: endonuclease V [Flavobacteriales bacterium]
MILAIDIHYKENIATCVAVLFDWEDELPQRVITENLEGVYEYIPGEFYKRELPCILALMKKIELKEIEILIVDGHVYTDNETYGLGGHTWEALEKKIPIIGVAKRPFHNNGDTVKEVYRGGSKNPLYVSSIGMKLKKAEEYIQNMKGEYRMPTILTELDKVTKGN